MNKHKKNRVREIYSEHKLTGDSGGGCRVLLVRVDTEWPICTIYVLNRYLSMDEWSDPIVDETMIVAGPDSIAIRWAITAFDELEQEARWLASQEPDGDDTD